MPSDFSPEIFLKISLGFFIRFAYRASSMDFPGLLLEILQGFLLVFLQDYLLLLLNEFLLGFFPELLRRNFQIFFFWEFSWNPCLNF